MIWVVSIVITVINLFNTTHDFHQTTSNSNTCIIRIHDIKTNISHKRAATDEGLSIGLKDVTTKTDLIKSRIEVTGNIEQMLCY